MKPGSRYLLTYQLADAEPVTVLGRYLGPRPMVTRDDEGQAFEVGNVMLILTPAAIVNVVPSLEVSDVA